VSDCAKIHKEIGGSQNCYSTERSANEKGKSFAIQCDKGIKICRLKLDKGIMIAQQNQKQCDYLFVREYTDSNLFDFFFVELKGSAKEADYAYEQIIQAINFVKTKVDVISKNCIWAFIIGGADTQNMNRLKEKFKRDIGVMLKHNTGNRYEHHVK
jgi:hypothetical protein